MITLTLLVLVLVLTIAGVVLFLAGLPFAALLALDLILPVGVLLGLWKLIFGKNKK